MDFFRSVKMAKCNFSQMSLLLRVFFVQEGIKVSSLNEDLEQEVKERRVPELAVLILCVVVDSVLIYVDDS